MSQDEISTGGNNIAWQRDGLIAGIQIGLSNTLIVAQSRFEAVPSVRVVFVNFRPGWRKKEAIVTNGLDGRRWQITATRGYRHSSINDASVKKGEPSRGLVISDGHCQRAPSK
jgi:hypothetical protein